MQNSLVVLLRPLTSRCKKRLLHFLQFRYSCRGRMKTIRGSQSRLVAHGGSSPPDCDVTTCPQLSQLSSSQLPALTDLPPALSSQRSHRSIHRSQQLSHSSQLYVALLWCFHQPKALTLDP